MRLFNPINTFSLLDKSPIILLKGFGVFLINVGMAKGVLGKIGLPCFINVFHLIDCQTDLERKVMRTNCGVLHNSLRKLHNSYIGAYLVAYLTSGKSIQKPILNSVTPGATVFSEKSNP